MSQLGIRWRIDGVPAAFVTHNAVNGRYCVTFERSEAGLEQIEGINWAAPTLERVTEVLSEPGLPEGYGFELKELRYQHTAGTFIAEVQTTQQYWGDVTLYQEQISGLNQVIAQQQTTVDTLNETVSQQQAAMAEQADRLDTMAANMEHAYQEGVEAHG